ncbi:hypothetical protein TorRG33x02_037480 [Trema orientale]|uniref:Uncharacterized protein n=1 Tax=Trema orientale TaxID=63057 RepID=A0A2P5FRA7_TREOI|nr:hypothetical protein TorRG33x02_037480 [Trema orientale]
MLDASLAHFPPDSLCLTWTTNHITPSIEDNVKAFGVKREGVSVAEEQVLSILYVLVPAKCRKKSMEIIHPRIKLKTFVSIESVYRPPNIMDRTISPDHDQKSLRSYKRQTSLLHSHFFNQGPRSVKLSHFSKNSNHGMVFTQRVIIARLLTSPQKEGERRFPIIANL